MSFAQKILEKYGWKEGDGLGKDNSGITKPLKANFKFDSAGLGVDRAEEFNNHWWERIFNEAANNVKIEKINDDVSVNVKNEESVEITTKEYSVRKLKKEKDHSYDNFLLSSTLTNTGSEVSNPNKIDVDKIKVASYRVLTDEELFVACDGRTAHKGARHGLKLSGKLARIEQQEKEMLEKMQANSSEPTASKWTVVKSKKKKEKKKQKPEEPKERIEDEEGAKINDILYTADYCIKSKKKRKEKKKTEEELSGSLGVISLENKEDNGVLLGIGDHSKGIKKLKKSKKGKKKAESVDWNAYRSSAVGDGDEHELVGDSVLTAVAGTNCSQDDETKLMDTTKKKMSKKCKHGIDKEAKEAYKKAKKLKKKLKKMTENLEQSCLAVS